MDGKNNSSFWPSYVDIMTTLFAITLILFAVSFSRFKTKEKELQRRDSQMQLLLNEYESIITVYTTVGEIDSTEYFNYYKQYLKHLFTVDVEYQTGEYRIDRLKLDNVDRVKADNKRDSIIIAGKIIKETIMKLENSDSIGNIRFLVVIEGQSSKIPFHESDWKNNYTLSYLRAQFLDKFWKEHDIDLSAIPKCELIISGSGEGGVPRIVPNEEELHNQALNEKNYNELWKREEEKNQRFLIHIVPVIGNIDVTKARIDSLQRNR